MSAYEGSKMQEADEDRKGQRQEEASRVTNIPDGDGEDWEIGKSSYTRQEVFKMLFTQRAMISNDVKRSGVFEKVPKEVVDILENPRTPII